MEAPRCGYSNTVVNSLVKLKEHRLQHSSTKKYLCRVCKIKGYTHADDRYQHKHQCCHDHNCRIVNSIVVPKDNPENIGQIQAPEINVQKVQTGARKKLFNVSEKTKKILRGSCQQEKLKQKLMLKVIFLLVRYPMVALNYLGVVRIVNQKVFTSKIVLKEIHLQAPLV